MYAKAQWQSKTHNDAMHKLVLRTPSMPSVGLPNSVLLSLLEKTDTAAVNPPNKTGLSDAMKARFERLMGMPLEDVRVHRNSDKPAELDALAYAKGNEIHLGPGQEKHLEHELGHVVQQRQGEVKKTDVIHNAAVNEEDALEANANFVTAKSNFDGFARITDSEPVIQFCGKDSKEYWEKNKAALLQGISQWDGWFPLCFNPTSNTMTFQRDWDGKTIRAHVHYVGKDKHPVAGHGWIQGVNGFDFNTPLSLVENAPPFLEAQNIDPPPKHKSFFEKKKK